MSSYYFVGQSPNNGPGTWTTGTFTSNVTIGGTLSVGGNATFAGITTPTPFKSGSTTVSTVDAGGMVVPAVINTTSFYVAEEFDRTTTSYFVAGTNSLNYNIAIPNGVSAAIFTPSTLGGAYVGTTTATQGGCVVAAQSINIVKSTTINYQWRFSFYVGTLSDATNPYTLVVGGMVLGNATGPGVTPFAGPYISYTHSTNSGRWVLGSATGSVQTTANSTTAVTSGWHTLTISLANGVYTYVVDGATLGTVNDTNLSTSVTNTQGASIGGIVITPTSAFTTARYAAIERCDFYVTGLSR